ncbi:MAG: hypothetical protein ACOYMZ_02050 [Minisyncoccia bacterium]
MEKIQPDFGVQVRAFYKPRIRRVVILFFLLIIADSTLFIILLFSAPGNDNTVTNGVLLFNMVSIILLFWYHEKYIFEQDCLIRAWSGEDTLFGLFHRNIPMGMRKSFKQILEENPKAVRTQFAKRFKIVI